MTHGRLKRAGQVATYWASEGCPVVFHIDKSTDPKEVERLKNSMARFDHVRFIKQRRCEWGTWSLVDASLAASETMLNEFPEVRHVFLSSGSCLPLQPARKLRAFLDAHPTTNFIESVTTKDVPWTVGGLNTERFTMRFPFAWKSQRLLFDLAVRVQRRLGIKRRMPEGITPHLGSQWWCLTRETLKAILTDPLKDRYVRYFRRVWIPDESYYQTLVRLYSTNIESRSLTLSKFDFQGKPHIFYDDHLPLLRRSDKFVARKIWAEADRLYAAFLGGHAMGDDSLMSPGKIDRVFTKAVERRTRGRPGLYMSGRYPRRDWENGLTAAPYVVFEGFSDLFEDFDDWLKGTSGLTVHGHLFAPLRAEFADRQTTFAGALSDSPTLRDYNPQAFLANLIWNTRGEQQAFHFGPRDTQDIASFIARDGNANVYAISGAWAVPLLRKRGQFADIRAEAARLQKIEAAHLDQLRHIQTRARVRVWSMADFVDQPMEALQQIVDDLGPRGPHRLREVPRMVNLSGFGSFLQELRNQGMEPHLMGDFPTVFDDDEAPAPSRPRLVQ